MMPSDPSGDIRPIPDPTKLTTEMLNREITRVEKESAIEVLRLRELHELDIRRLHELADQTVRGLRDKVDCVEEIVGERLTAVKLQFDLVERQRVESKEDNTRALDAALAAMKDSHVSLGNTYNSAHGTLVARVDAIDKKITTLESMRMGSKETNTSVYAALGIILTIIWIAIAILSYVHR